MKSNADNKDTNPSEEKNVKNDPVTDTETVNADENGDKNM